MTGTSPSRGWRRPSGSISRRPISLLLSWVVATVVIVAVPLRRASGPGNRCAAAAPAFSGPSSTARRSPSPTSVAGRSSSTSGGRCACPAATSSALRREVGEHRPTTRDRRDPDVRPPTRPRIIADHGATWPTIHHRDGGIRRPTGCRRAADDFIDRDASSARSRSGSDRGRLRPLLCLDLGPRRSRSATATAVRERRGARPHRRREALRLGTVVGCQLSVSCG